MKGLKWSKGILLGIVCASLVGFTGGCGDEVQIENDIGLEMATEIDGLEVHESMKYKKDTEAMGDTKILENAKASAHETYEAFLAGETAVCDKETGEEKNISSLLETENGTYLYCDINGDRVDELHVKSDRYYYVLEAEGAKLDIIYEGTVYEYPVNEADVCGVLYYREGDAPKHNIYQFYTFGILGKTGESVKFEWYDNNENGEMDEVDSYLYDGKGRQMEEWLEETEGYRNIDVENMTWENW